MKRLLLQAMLRRRKQLKTTKTPLLASSSSSSSDSKMNWTKDDELLILEEYVPCAEQESLKIDNGEKDKDGVDDLCVLQEALVLTTSFQSLGNNQRKSLLQNLRNVGAKQRKELEEEWKALLVKEMQLDIKKQSFYAKLVNAGFSA